MILHCRSKVELYNTFVGALFYFIASPLENPCVRPWRWWPQHPKVKQCRTIIQRVIIWFLDGVVTIAEVLVVGKRKSYKFPIISSSVLGQNFMIIQYFLNIYSSYNIPVFWGTWIYNILVYLHTKNIIFLYYEKQNSYHTSSP